jgi:hypothetical protein
MADDAEIEARLLRLERAVFGDGNGGIDPPDDGDSPDDSGEAGGEEGAGGGVGGSSVVARTFDPGHYWRNWNRDRGAW